MHPERSEGSDLVIMPLTPTGNVVQAAWGMVGLEECRTQTGNDPDLVATIGLLS